MKLRDRKMVGGGSSDYLPDLVPALGLRDRARRRFGIVYLVLSNCIIISVYFASAFKHETDTNLKFNRIFRIHAEGENSRLTWLGCFVTRAALTNFFSSSTFCAARCPSLEGKICLVGRPPFAKSPLRLMDVPFRPVA